MKKSENDEVIKHLAKKNNYSIEDAKTLDYYYDLPIMEKTVLILGLGSNLRGNMLYVMKALHQEEFEGYTIYFCANKDSKENVEQVIEDYHFDRAKIVMHTKEYTKLLYSVKYLITEVRFPSNWIKKEGQVYVNIWHGTPLKCLGLDKNTKNIHKDGKTQRNFIDADYLLYPNDYTREHMLDAYRVRNLTHAKALMCGYPRSSILLDEKECQKAKEELAPNGEQVFSYMPTWRDGRKVEELINEMQFMLDSIDMNLMDYQILYVNLHHKIGDSLDYSHFRHIKKFPKDMDNYQVLAGTDILFTDYSSVFFDFLVTRRKIVLYCPDIDEYFKTRGTYTNLKAMSFAKAYTNAQLIKELNTPKKYNDQEDFDTYCNYDTVDNAKNVCKIFTDNLDGLHLMPIEANGKSNIVIYSECLQKDDSTILLRKYTRIYGKKDRNLYISCSDERVDKYKTSAYSIITETPVIGVTNGILFTAAQSTVHEMYLNNVIDFETYIDLTKESYQLENHRVYGCAQFDTAVLYESDDPQRILAYSQMTCRKLFFIQDSMIKEVENGNTFLKDACYYMMKKSDKVCVISEEVMEKAQLIWGEEVGTMTLVDDESKLKDLIG